MAVCMLNGSVEAHGKCDRRHGRVRLEATDVTLGKVLDLSRSGMRIRTSRNLAPNSPPIEVGLTIGGERVTVLCKIAWCKKDGMFKRQAGLEFQGLDDARIKQLAELARTAASNSAIQHSILGRAG